MRHARQQLQCRQVMALKELNAEVNRGGRRPKTTRTSRVAKECAESKECVQNAASEDRLIFFLEPMGFAEVERATFTPTHNAVVARQVAPLRTNRPTRRASSREHLDSLCLEHSDRLIVRWVCKCSQARSDLSTSGSGDKNTVLKKPCRQRGRR